MLRIIGGEARGRKLHICKGRAIRPTADRIKEALFNILREKISGAEVLDLFAGVGSLGIEALSRGAKKAVFIDQEAICVSIIRKNLACLDFHNQAEVYQEEAGLAVRRLARQGREFDLIFLDPPYRSELAEKTLGDITTSHLLRKKGIVIVEHYWKKIMPEKAGRLKLVRAEKYGDTALSFYENTEDTD